MRLTVELLQNSPSWLNALKERELDLRGHRITTIENLGVAGPQDAIDFVDNDIQVLGNLPLSPRIKSLLLARNRVTTIQPTIANSIPNLTNLQLESNNLRELADLDPLGSLPFLTHLVLKDNPVTKKEHYRYWVLWRCPSVRFLDYQKVKDAERQQARELFGESADTPTELASKIMGVRSKAFDSSSSAMANGGSSGSTTSLPTRMSRIKLTDKEKKRLQDMIKNATSLDEITRLETMIREGRIPAGVQIAGDEMEE
ncbi:leucine-rich repeat-domain-containing protein [Microdochium trichocladiopsis]|uniref:U2 small nuclear ribonucleoprotein A' n=1 Tax=Microdochium trichocladiopsis TaxID=1682393 RepID=A0A9P8Y9R5_9PEZI|nr:leucine-rich repeat-domain-containing protein [Microdochium trichocladiopsis]KAH7031290.1 leucine-rich repeat-domain-containing protein [Microdochium trichocladiopsis]